MSDEVSDFLRSVELLKGRREEEDEARSRELEQKILAEKAERQARRLERARSISPQKSSPANTHHHRTSIASIASTIQPPDGVDLSSPAHETTGSPRAHSVQLSDPMEPLSLASPTKENESPSSPSSPPSSSTPFDSSEPSKRSSQILTSPSAAMPSARPLSWQRRPTSQASERPKTRPLSVYAAENAAASRANAAITSPTEEQPPQSETAQVEDEDTVDTSHLSRTQLPDMAQDASAHTPAATEPEATPARQSLLNSPLITSAPRLDPPTGDSTHDEPEPPSNRMSMMSPNSRASPATSRTGSPTKGLGGFVQSAMMKRSDSVKRWSVNSAGLARAESTASNRNSIFGPQLGSPTKPDTQPDATTQDDSNPKPASRPASIPVPSYEEDRPVTPAPLSITPQPSATETKETNTEGGEEENTSIPVSPSKTMDPRRWSPSKSSSWLEAALNKPESPKTKPAPNANQPAWMVELNKAKAQKTGNTSVDLSRSASVPLRKTEVKTGGLMRTTPVGSGLKPSTGLSISTSAAAAEKPALSGLRNDLVSPLLRKGSEDPASLAKTPTTEEASTPVLKDFRANLKSRAPPSSGAGTEGEVDELKNVFGKLRRAKTEKWVAPDPLKDNILRGKSLLNHTGGPMRSERKDELKEAILKKKEEFQKAKQEGQSSPTKAASPVVSEKAIPEALARRLELGRSGSFSSKSVDLPSSASSVTSPSAASPGSILDFDRTGLLSPKRRELTDIAAQIAPKPTTGLDKEASATNEVQSTTPKAVNVPGRLSKVGGLADRFNPALAGLLAKGPPAAASGASKGSGAAEEETTPKPGPQLTHMTKNRARGPRRKAPTSVLKPAEDNEERLEVESPPAAKEAVSSPIEEKQVTPTMPKPEFITRVDSRASVKSHGHQRSGSVADLVNSFKTKVAEEPKPAEQPNTADLPSRSPTKITRGRSATKVLEQATVFAALNQQPSEPVEPKSEMASASPARPALSHTRSKSKVHEQAALFTTLNRQPSEAAEPTKEPVAQSPVRPALSHTRSKSKVQEQAAAFVNKMKAEPSERSAETSPVRPALGHTRSKSKVHEQIAALAAASQKPSEAASEAAPSTPTSIRGRSRAKSIVQEKLAALVTADHQMKPAEPEADMAAQSPSPRKLDMKRMSRFLDEQTQPILNPETEKTSRPSSPVKQRAFPDFPRTSSTKDVSPVKDTKVDSEPVVSVKAGSALFGGGANAGLPQVTTKPTSPPPTEPAAATTTSLPPRGPVKTPTPEPRTELPPRLPLSALSSPSFTSSRRPSVPEQAPLPEPQPQPEVQSPPPPKVPPKSARPLPATPEAEAPPVPRKDSIPLPSLPNFDFQQQPQPRPQQQAQQQQQPQSPQHQQTQQQPRGLRHTRSASKYGSDAQALLSDFFGTERPRRRYMADAADVIMRRPNPGFRIQTQRAQLYQFAADGKKLPVPAHRERILFEREMYLCTHTFTNESGKKVSEVYFWVGDEVPEAVTDDALMYAAREARTFGGKLVKMVQGKETSEFMQALGGIVIIRRGSSNKFDSLAQTMFCGRRFLGQVAFDEVDFAPSSLCSGFPYLITKQGKCYLWKGKGSDVDELGCARLVGMDLSLMGELEEIEEGFEPPNFWRDIFGGEGPGVRPMSADHWRLKPNYEKYCGRLFCSNANASGKDQIVEISPFKQTDLLSTNIYVLDAFFEMYIIVGARSQDQYASFHNALDFAQEYSILAAGMEDRPFVPISTVVLEGIPRDLKSVFRKWSDSLSPTIMNHLGGNVTVGGGSPPADVRSPGSVRSFSNSSIMSQHPGQSGQTQQGPGLRRGRSLRIVPLNQALKALQD
ncbi:uncharacterized protein B0T23DRAFT_403646 [Neurospora hispaniola]|uniref:DUF4045 domain-containing protein n=1 Tax=Neurospora hispaniola TaxID=588809 RepID=A0AAJ0IA54_9PEZI|nr:hypothetical protein B0T23DRAFT_403646 [Neurospora hispaniola]